jgi:hypothetical protein
MTSNGGHSVETQENSENSDVATPAGEVLNLVDTERTPFKNSNKRGSDK